MDFIDLCAGIGGISLGLERAGMKCVAQIEIDDYATKVLEKHWPDVPRWRNVKTCARELPAADVIAGGYPCQPFSLAGKRKGTEDHRHLWPYVFEIVQTLRPSWCLFENVLGHVTLGLDTVLSDLEGGGYSAWPLIIPAVAVDAPHRRDRVWIVANADSERCEEQRHGEFRDSKEIPWSGGNDSLARWRRWVSEPGICRMADGIPRRVDRIRCLGNAVVPQVVEQIGRCIMAAERT